MTSTSTAGSEEINPRFIADGVDDPNILLRPLDGYQNADQSSLEEATKPIASLFRNIERDVGLSKQATQAMRSHLSHDETAAIYLYTAESVPRSLYNMLNERLREADRRQLEPWFPYLNLFLTALFKIPSVTTTVWRGVKADLHPLYEVGKLYTWWSFTSCSLSVQLFESPMYLGDCGHRTLFAIECFSGKPIKAYSSYQHEDEVLLLPGTYLEMTGKATLADGLHIIYMREVKSPHVLLEPPIGSETVQDITVILDSVYEVNQENDEVPKLFLLLPDPSFPWNRVDFDQNQLLCHFICECSTLEIHLASYPGYAVPCPRQFLEYYSRYVQQFMNPLAEHLYQSRRIDHIHDEKFWNTFRQGVRQLQEMMTKVQDRMESSHVTLLDTRELPHFFSPFQRRGAVPDNYRFFSLGNWDAKLFSNLCRSVTTELVVRWVCTEHYPKDQLEALYRLGTLSESYYDIATGNVSITHFFNSQDSIQQFQEIVPMHTRCYYLNFRIAVCASLFDRLEEILKTISRITSLSLGNIRFRVDGTFRGDELSDEVLRRFIESNLHTKHIIPPGRELLGMEAVVNVAITTVTLRSLAVRTYDCPNILQNVSFIQRLTPKLSSLSVTVPQFSKVLPHLCEFLRQSKKLKQLHLAPIGNLSENSALITDDLRQLCEAICACPTITRLHICYKMTDADAPLLAKIIRSCYNLMSLTLEKTVFTGLGMSCMMEESEKSNRLLFLYFGHLTNSIYTVRSNISTEEFPIARCLTATTPLITYAVSDVRIRSNEIGDLAGILKTNTTLAHLSLQNTLSTEQAALILSALRLNSSLLSLDLSGTPMGRAEVGKLAKCLQSKGSNLRMLYLSECELTDTAVHPLLIALTPNQRMTHLYLDRNHLGNEGARQVAAMMTWNVSLTCLSVNGNEWTTDGLGHLARALSRNSTLTEFYWEPHRSVGFFGERAVAAIYRALSENGNIMQSSDCYGAEEQRNLLLVKRPDLILA